MDWTVGTFVTVGNDALDAGDCLRTSWTLGSAAGPGLLIRAENRCHSMAMLLRLRRRQRIQNHCVKSLFLSQVFVQYRFLTAIHTRVDIALLQEGDKSRKALVISGLILYRCKNERFWGGGEPYIWVANQAAGFIGVTTPVGKTPGTICRLHAPWVGGGVCSSCFSLLPIARLSGHVT